MKKLFKILQIGIVFVFVCALASGCEEGTSVNNISESNTKVEEHKVIICDGVNIVANCEVDGIEYTTYKFYPATPEKSHMETKTTYVKEVTGYCTLCNDGTRSPTCATGSGTCSHHGGVAQWNAPVYSDVPHYEEVKIIDSPDIAEYYEKILK